MGGTADGTEPNISSLRHNGLTEVGTDRRVVGNCANFTRGGESKARRFEGKAADPGTSQEKQKTRRRGTGSGGEGSFGREVPTRS